MRIAFAMYCFEDRAQTTMSFWVARELAKRGHLVTLLALSRRHRFRSERQVQDGVRLLLTPRGVTGRWHYDGWDPQDLLTRYLHFRREHYDVLVASDCRANVYLPFCAARGKVNLRIAHWGDLWGQGGLAKTASRFGFQRQLEEKWERKMMLDADGVIASSRNLLALGRKWGAPDSRMCWIPHGSAVDLIRPLPKEWARSRAGLAANHPVMGYIGHTLEDLDSFFPTIRRLVSRYPQMAVLCVGKCSQRDRAKVEQAGLTPYFRFTGFVPTAEVGQWLACADFFLLPLSPNSVNDRYRYPGKLGDYMAAGRPVIAPEVGEAAWVIREAKVGVAVRPDLVDLEDRICELIEDPSLMEQMGAQARRAAEEQFAWSVLASRFEAFLSNLTPH